MGLLELLQASDVAGFNEARDRAGRIELFAEELAELKLEGVDLSGAVLDKSDLTETDLTEASLVGASLNDIDGTKAIFDGSLAMGCRLRDAWLEEADLTGADLSRGDLSGAVLNKTKGEALRLLSARMKEAQAIDASWPLADLSEAVAKGADFSGADLSRAKLTETRMGGAKLNGATLDGADAEGVKLGGAIAQKASFVGARLVGAHLSGADLTGAVFRDADLSKANLSGAIMAGADLSGARLVGALLDGVDLSTAILDGADLTGLDTASLGIGAEVAGTLAAHGVAVDPDADIVLEEPAVATQGEAVALLWFNPDSLEAHTVRWGVRRPDGSVVTGVLPVPAASVLFHTVLSAGEAFRLVCLVERADGHALVAWPLGIDGTLGRSEASPLGYEPLVRPILREHEGAIACWGLARRGPTIVVHRDALDGAGFQLVGSDPKPQARGFLGRTHPVLLCKGRVAMTLGPTGVGAPLGLPEGFPTRVSASAPLAEGALAVWNTPEGGRDPGGLRVQVLGPRASREPDVLTERPDVNGLDALPDGDAVVVAWTEDEGPDGGKCFVARLPDGEAVELPLPHEPLDQVRLFRDGAGGALRVAVTSLTGRLIVRGIDGSEVADLDEERLREALAS